MCPQYLNIFSYYDGLLILSSLFELIFFTPYFFFKLHKWYVISGCGKYLGSSGRGSSWSVWANVDVWRDVLSIQCKNCSGMFVYVMKPFILASSTIFVIDFVKNAQICLIIHIIKLFIQSFPTTFVKYLIDCLVGMVDWIVDWVVWQLVGMN